MAKARPKAKKSAKPVPKKSARHASKAVEPKPVQVSDGTGTFRPGKGGKISDDRSAPAPLLKKRAAEPEVERRGARNQAMPKRDEAGHFLPGPVTERGRREQRVLTPESDRLIRRKVREVIDRAKAEEAPDMIKTAPHYMAYKIQPIEFIAANKIGYLPGNVIKYVCRHKLKNGIEDLKKARQYLEWMIDEAEGRAVVPPHKK